MDKVYSHLHSLSTGTFFCTEFESYAYRSRRTFVSGRFVAAIGYESKTVRFTFQIKYLVFCYL